MRCGIAVCDDRLWIRVADSVQHSPAAVWLIGGGIIMTLRTIGGFLVISLWCLEYKMTFHQASAPVLKKKIKNLRRVSLKPALTLLQRKTGV